MVAPKKIVTKKLAPKRNTKTPPKVGTNPMTDIVISAEKVRYDSSGKRIRINEAKFDLSKAKKVAPETIAARKKRLAEKIAANKNKK